MAVPTLVLFIYGSWYPSLSWVIASESGDLSPAAQYGFAGALLLVSTAGVAWYAKAVSKEKEDLRATIREKDLEIKVLNDRMLSDIIPATTQVAQAASQLTRFIENAKMG